MEDALKPGIYDTLKRAECLDYKQGELGPAIEDLYGVDLVDIKAKTRYFGGGLKRIHDEILRGPRLQMHRIGKYWSPWQHDDFKKHLKMLDIVKETYDSDEEWMEKSVDSVEGGLAYRKKGDLYIIPNPVEKISTIAQFIIPLTLCSAGMISIMSEHTVSFIGGAKILSLPLSAVACGLFSEDITKNPMLYLADEMGERTEYVCSRLKD